MSDKDKDMNIKIQTFHIFISIKNFDWDKIEIAEKSYQSIFIYYIGYVMIKDSNYVKINSVNSLYLFFFDKVNEYFEKVNGKKYLTLVPTNESKEKTWELWS